MSVVGEMLAILRADTAWTTLLTGGTYDRPLSPDDPETEQAWQSHPVTGVRRLQPCAVMLPPQEVDHPLARNPGRRLDIDLWPELVLYAEGADVLALFDAADARAMSLLHGQRIGLADISATGYRARPLDANELPGKVMTTFRRYRAQTVRHISEV